MPPFTLSLTTSERVHWRALPWLILVIGSFLSCVLFTSIRQQNMSVLQHEFAIRTGELVAGLERRVAANSQLLSGIGGLFASRGKITLYSRATPERKLPRHSRSGLYSADPCGAAG